MSWPVGLAGGGAFVAALAIGIAFGFVLERAGLGQPKQLLGLFYLEDRFRPLAELRALFVSRGVTPDERAVTYCQTHHRGSRSCFVLRLLGYPRVAGYDRSWVQRGNRDDLPVAP